MIRTPTTAFAALVLVGLLEGCAMPAFLGAVGVAGSGAVAGDRRTTGTILEDEAIEWKVRTALHGSVLTGDRHHVSVTSFNRIVLLTGQVPDEETKRRATAAAERVVQVRGVHNELVVGSPTSIGRRSDDILVTGNVKLAMTTSRDTPGEVNVNVKVVTENAIVFLMGLVTREESEKVTETVRTVPGVAQIVRLFEYIEARPET